MAKETNTMAIFYGITPRRLSKLLEEVGNENYPHQDENSASYELGHTSYSCDTEKRFIKNYLKDLVLKERLKEGKKKLKVK